MAYTYKGTKITGTSTSDKVFKKSGVSNAKKGQTYFNTDTGHVYKCTEKGKPADAKWRYVRTDIAKKPSVTVSKLTTPARTGYKYRSEWKVPSALTDNKKGNRAQKIQVTWTLNMGVFNSETKKTKKDKKRYKKTGGTGYTDSTFNIDTVKFGKKTGRECFWPVTKRKLNSISISVRPRNSKGAGKAVTKTYDLQVPKEPKLSAFEFDTETGRVSITITSDAGTGAAERYDTYYKMVVENTRTGKKYTPDRKEGTTKSTSYTLSWDPSDYQQLSYSDYIRITVTAYTRGLQGNSPKVSKTYYVSYPSKPTISKVEASGGKFTAYITVYPEDTEGKKEEAKLQHPVDRVKLEYLANSTYSKASLIPGDAAWESTDITDNGNCTALAVPAVNLIPDPGKYTWVRVKAWHANEAVLYRYSNYKLTEMEVAAPTAADDNISILSATAGVDGRSVLMHLGWNADGQDDSTGTELSWSDAEDAWKSTDDPDDYTFTWSDGPIYERTKDTVIVEGKTYYTRSGEGTPASPYVYTEVDEPVAGDLDNYYEITFHDSATITIKGLEEGTLYHIKARRYLDGDDATTYSDYSNTVHTFTTETPETIVATCDRYIPEGASLPIYWTLSGNGLQTKWQIMMHNSTVAGIDFTYAPTTDTDIVKEKTYYTRSGSGTEQDPYVYEEVADPVVADLGNYYERTALDGTVITKGEGSTGYTRLDASRLEELAYEGSLAFTVQATTGSEYVISDVITVTIRNAPTLAVSLTSPLTVQPLEFDATVSTICDLRMIVTSRGVSGQFPEGVLNQTAGDTVYSDVVSPAWEENVGEGTFTATTLLPSGLDFWDTGEYELSVVAIDRETGLQSIESLSLFTIAWAHQAPSPLPTETYTLTSDTEVDETKTYYRYDDEEQIYVAVIPVGTENPSEEGWFEMSSVSYVTLTPIDEVDDNGMHHQAVEIALTPPANSEETDVYDLYRMTGDGAVLIGEGFPLTVTATDEYAPFGDDMTHHYRIAVRTVDGDVEFGDFEYVLDCSFMRFDWDAGTIELPYNISIGDTYKKDVDIRAHMDGTTDGYWNPNISRTASLNTDVIRLTMQDEIDAARALARYTGPVFVRTPDGSAYEADVQVTDMSTEGIIMAIAIDATEVGLTQEFMLPTPYDHTEEES